MRDGGISGGGVRVQDGPGRAARAQGKGGVERRLGTHSSQWSPRRCRWACREFMFSSDDAWKILMLSNNDGASPARVQLWL